MKIFLKYLFFGSLLALIQTNFIKAQINNEGIVSYYPFNGNANDESISSNDGTVYGPMLVQDRFGNPNSAYQFDGLNDYILTEPNNQLDQYSFGSVSFWIKPMNGVPSIVQSILSYSTLEFHNSVYHFSLFQNQINVSFKFGGSYYTPVIEANGILESNKWYYIVVTSYETNRIKIYINGIEQSTIFKPFVTSADGTEWFADFYGTNLYNHFVGIGAVKRSSSSESFFNGVIDDIKIYDYTLLENDINEAYYENNWLNAPPVANAGEDQTIECTGFDGTEVTLDGSGSSDPDEDELTYTWYSGEDIVSGSSDEPTAILNLQLGTYTFTLDVNDGTETSTDEVVITIEDTTPPTLTVNEQYKIWPVNHKYVKLDIDDMISSLDDGCSIELQIENVVISKVTSDELEDDPSDGDGSTLEDMIIYDGCTSVGLRAERLGESNGRVYTVTLSIADASGNIGSVDFEAYVPHDVKDMAMKDEAAYFVNGACEVPMPSELLAKSTFENNNSITVVHAVPSDYILHQNYPNPFNPKTNIQFSIPQSNHVSLRIYDQLGKEITILVDQIKSAGSYTYEFDGSNLSSGIYVYRLQAGEFIDTKKLVLMK